MDRRYFVQNNFDVNTQTVEFALSSSFHQTTPPHHNFYHWRSQDFVLRGPENRGAEFASGEGNGEGVSPSPAEGVWGSVVSSPSGVRGSKTDFGAF